jgi:hypothetical protein
MNLLKKLSVLVLMSIQSTLIWAQDKKVDVDISVGKGQNNDWYQQPWLWVVGGAVFILLLVVLLKNKKE